MPTIENYATINYTSGGVAVTKVSNLAEIQLESSVAFTKSTLGTTYSDSSIVTYILTITNTSSSPINNVVITDDLGSFTEGTLELTPLSYLAPAQLFINGQNASGQLTVDASATEQVVFSFPTLAAGATANILYRAVINEYAPLCDTASITNTASLTSDSECANSTASTTITAALAADVSVFKQMSPNPVVCGETVTYSIRVYNYGNIPAENIQLVDAFDPAPTNITVSLDGVILPATAYTYENGVLTIPSAEGSETVVAAATCSRDATTGVVSVTPGMIEYVITGTI
jgi:uncharacterized repeat protein (TIGR01451 family)